MDSIEAQIAFNVLVKYNPVVAKKYPVLYKYWEWALPQRNYESEYKHILMNDGVEGHGSASYPEYVICAKCRTSFGVNDKFYDKLMLKALIEGDYISKIQKD